MINYCPICGRKRYENSLFCIGCGTKLEEEKIEFEILSRPEKIKTFEKQIAHTSKESRTIEHMIYMPPTYNTQPQNQIRKKQPQKKRILIPVLTIAIAVMVISASLLIIFNAEPNDSSNLNEITTLVREHGPKVSLHSLSGGTVSSIPKEGYTATYGLYDQSGIFGISGLRIGEIVEENLGDKTFQGEECILTKINGEISLPMKNYIESYKEVSSYLSTDSTSAGMSDMIPEELPLYIYSDYYVKKEDNTPVYMDYKIDFTEYMQILKEISVSIGYEDEMNSIDFDGPVIMGYTIDWDRDQSKADMRFYIEGIPIMSMDGDFSIKFSEEYWDMEPEMEELYVGFEKIIEFTMTLEINDFNFGMDYGIEEEEESVYEIEDLYEEENYEHNIEEELEDFSQTVSTSMEIKVTDKENVNVPAGEFEDCFVIEVNQRQDSGYEDNDYEYEISSSHSITSSTKIWVNENGVMPKAEYSLFGGTEIGMGTNNQKLVIKLEDYKK